MLQDSFEQTEKPTNALPWRNRSCVPRDVWTFVEKKFTTYVTAEAREQLARGTGAAAPGEAVALLLGRSFVDAEGSWTLVSAATFADSQHAHGRTFVELSAQQTRYLRDRANRAYPLLDVCGWAHSHPGPSGYSSTDLDEMAKWPEEQHVGVLTYMAGPGWGRVYHGSQAKSMVLFNEAQVERRTSVAAESAHVTRLRDEGAPEPTPWGTELPAFRKEAQAVPLALRRRRPSLPAVGMVALVALLALVTSAATWAGRAQAPVDPVAAPTAGPELAALCRPLRGSAPLVVSCAGTGLPRGAETFWSVDDKDLSMGSATTRALDTAGHHTLRMVTITNQGIRSWQTTLIVDQPQGGEAECPPVTCTR